MWFEAVDFYELQQNSVDKLKRQTNINIFGAEQQRTTQRRMNEWMKER